MRLSGYSKKSDEERLIENEDSLPMQLRLNKFWLTKFRLNFRNLLTTICLVLFLIYLLREYRQPSSIPVEFEHFLRLMKMNGSLTGKCKVPELDPWHPSILKYYKKMSPLQCTALQEKVVAFEDGILKIRREFQDDVTCQCRTFVHNAGASESADYKVKYNEWIDVEPNSGTKIDSDFVEVVCYSSSLLKTKKYSYHYNQITKRNVSLITGRPYEKSSVEHPSVVVFGIDSMSRSNFIRSLPKTYDVMKSMGFIDMRSHVKVGDNTFPNWMAIMTGKRAHGTPEFEPELPEDGSAYFDDWPLIWKNFSEQNYVTHFAEDRPQVATFNLVHRYGFNKTPVDHYMRPYWLESYWSLLGRRSDPYCYDRTPFHALQLNYLKEFVQKYNGTRSFAWHWVTDLSHNFVNQVGVADDDFAQFLQQNQKYFQNSIILMLSDHGNRYDTILESAIGRLESRLPYLSFYLPENLKKQYPHLTENLEKNSHKMTTQFDLHQTFKDILDGNFKEAEDELPKKQRAYSLFREVPDVRSCHESNVPDDYCPCFDEIDLPDTDSQEPAEKLIGFINEEYENDSELRKNHKLSEGYKCLHLDLDKVDYAAVRLPPSALIEELRVAQADISHGIELRYHIVLSAKPPSGALLEGTVIKNLKTGKWSSTGGFNRNNKYGNTSHCVGDAELQKICYCIRI